MYYQYELTHFKGDMGHGVASDESANNMDEPCYYDYKLGLMISMTEPLPSWTHSWDTILLSAWRDYEPACCCFRSWYRVRSSL